ncbi:protein polyglycylase TTLL10-like isoform X2 [Ptychodera flava]|uniref:protein polyglycylase TTLL10-like isoform X2 n=2 Tax=Ptychodera flava TaxID=63121 RepID=UPI00396A04F7
MVKLTESNSPSCRLQLQMADDRLIMRAEQCWQDTSYPPVAKSKAEVFEVDFSDGKNEKNRRNGKKANLQEAFLKFKKERQKEYRTEQLMKERALSLKLDTERMWTLRMKFLDTAKQYFGVPYARRYHAPGTPDYDAPFFLDCCGLTRRVLRDLKEDFGFVVGPWNQAYQYDTLPITIEKEEDMKPGDLVFISAVFFNPKARKQRHNMVHVEIWAGDDIKTVGARWQKGHVQVFDSYKFVSKSYHSMVYHFKSIDTWLQGICKSYCPEHPWRKSKYEPGKKSVFALEDSDIEEDEAAEDFDDGDYVGDNATEYCHDNKEDISGNSRTFLSGEVRSDAGDLIDMTTQSHEGDVVNEVLMHEQNNEVPGVLSTSEDDTGKHNKRTGDSVEEDAVCINETEDDDNSFSDNCSICEMGTSDDEDRDVDCCCGNGGEDEYVIDSYYGEIEDESEDDDEPCDGDDKQTSKGSSIGGRGGERGSSNSTSNNNSGQGNRTPGGNRSSSGGDQNEQPNNQNSTVKSGKSKESGPAFYIGGGNGVSLVETPLLARGWRRIRDKASDDFKLKWVELKCNINYQSFREGEQLVNRIPNSSLLATKVGLITSLREYERVMDRVKKGTKQPRLLKMEEFVPESYILDYKSDRDAFFGTFKEGETWICKPTGMNQGKGIYLVDDITELKKKYLPADEQEHSAAPPTTQQKKKSRLPPMQRLIQRYVPNPLLLNGKKFDVRAYMLVGCTNPQMIFYHKGYLRLSCKDYDPEDKDLVAHLTNQYVQKKDPSYESVKEETCWSMDKFNDHVNTNLAEEKGLPENWVYGFFTKRMNQIMLQCFHSVKNKLQCKLGFFDLYGFDFLLDTDMKVWLLEINVNPALHVNCEALMEVIPGVIEETLDLTLEIFEKSRKGKPIMPLKALKGFKLLYNGSGSGGGGGGGQSTDNAVVPRSARPRSMANQRARSQSPVKRRPGVSPTRKKVSPYLAPTETLVKSSTGSRSSGAAS